MHFFESAELGLLFEKQPGLHSVKFVRILIGLGRVDWVGLGWLGWVGLSSVDFFIRSLISFGKQLPPKPLFPSGAGTCL